MSLLDERSEAFIVRIWLEHREIADAPIEWRGVIQHVTSGQQYYFTDLHRVVAVLKSYMAEMGIPFSYEENDG
jgi:hypothetical protein